MRRSVLRLQLAIPVTMSFAMSINHSDAQVLLPSLPSFATLLVE